MADLTKIVEEGKFTIYIDTTTQALGHTEDGVEITFDKAVLEIKTHETQDIPVKVIHAGTKIQLKVRAVEIDSDHLQYAFPEGSNAAGSTTITQDVGTVLSDTTYRVVVADSAGSLNKWTFSNMIAAPENITLLYRMGEKWILDLVFRGIWLDSGDRAKFTSS